MDFWRAAILRTTTILLLGLLIAGPSAGSLFHNHHEHEHEHEEHGQSEHGQSEHGQSEDCQICHFAKLGNAAFLTVSAAPSLDERPGSTFSYDAPAIKRVTPISSAAPRGPPIA